MSEPPPQTTFAPMIRWPNDRRWHWFTLRASYYRIHTYLQWLYITIVFAPSVVLVGVWHHNRTINDRVASIILLSLAGIYVLTLLTHIFPVWRTALFASFKTRRWRKQWRAAELQSQALRDELSSDVTTPEVDDLYASLPSLPALAWQMSDPTDAIIQTFRVKDSSAQDLKVFRRRIMALAAAELARCDERCVVGINIIEGTETVLAIYSPGGCTQFWAFFQVPIVGNVVSYRVMTGYQWWGVRGYNATGSYSMGEAFHTKVRECSVMTLKHFQLLFLFPLAPLYFLFRSLRQLVRPDIRRQLRVYTDPMKGDSVDLLLINSRRSWFQRGFGLTLMPNAIAEIKVLKQLVLDRLQNLPTRMTTGD